MNTITVRGKEVFCPGVAPGQKITVKGRNVFLNGVLVARIFGYREWHRGQAHGTYGITFVDKSKPDLDGYCYFDDVVKFLPAHLKDAGLLEEAK